MRILGSKLEILGNRNLEKTSYGGGQQEEHQRFGTTATPNKGIMFISDLVSVHRIFTRPVCPVVQRSGLDPATCHCPFGPFLLGEHHHVPKIIETVQTSCLGLVPVWVDRVVTNHWRSNLPLCWS